MAARLKTRWTRRRVLRGVGLAAVLLVVLAGHGWVSDWLEEDRIGWGASDAMPKRIEMQFVQELAQAKPPGAPPLPVHSARPAAAEAPAPSASEPVPVPVPDAAEKPNKPKKLDAPTPAIEPEPVIAEAATASAAVQETAASAATDVPVPDALVAAAADASASAPNAPASAASSATASAFEWPPSTRLSYVLTGNYRGPVQGSASVQWVHVGSRYQVQMDVFIGLKIAPLMSRLATSDGELRDDGLYPDRYDEVTRVGFGDPRRMSLHFDDKLVTLADGSHVPRPPDMQDTASQFVQITWLFTMHPELLQTGRTIDLPLAFARRIDHFSYDVLEADTLYTPFGPVPVMHVKPRRIGIPLSNTLSIEWWVAPTLQYLPAHIVFHQNDGTYADLVLEHAPMQAAAQR